MGGLGFGFGFGFCFLFGCGGGFTLGGGGLLLGRSGAAAFASFLNSIAVIAVIAVVAVVNVAVIAVVIVGVFHNIGNAILVHILDALGVRVIDGASICLVAVGGEGFLFALLLLGS